MATPQLERITVRPAAAGDVTAIVALWHEFGHPITREHASKQVRVHSRDRTACALVADKDGVVLGFSSYDSSCSFEFGSRMGWLTSLVVTKDARRTGVGRALVAEVERRARDAGCTVLSLTSGRRPDREAAHAFYPSLDFEDVCSHHALYSKQL